MLQQANSSELIGGALRQKRKHRASSARRGSVAAVISDQLLARGDKRPNGEIAWAPADAANVIRCVIAAGGRVHGFDLERRQPDGRYIEEPVYVSGDEASDREGGVGAKGSVGGGVGRRPGAADVERTLTRPFRSNVSRLATAAQSR